MKKNLEKIFASASVVVAVILIMVLLVTAFGGITTEEFQTKLVQGLLVTLSIIYIVLSIITLVLAFIASDALKEITIRSEQAGSVRITVSVINKFVKKACAEIEGVKCQKVAIVADDYGVRLKVNVRIVDKDVIEVETYLRTLLEDLFKGEFGFKFHSIEIKVTQLAPKYKADAAEIEAKVAKKLDEMKDTEVQEASADTGADEAPAAETVEDIPAEKPVAEEPTADVTAEEETPEAEAVAETEEIAEAEEAVEAAEETPAEEIKDEE